MRQPSVPVTRQPTDDGQVVTDVDFLVGYLFRRVHRALSAAADQVLGDLGLTVAQYVCLLVVGQRPGLSNVDLARRCFVTPQTMAAVVAGLERAGLVERRAHATHGRILETRRTAAGTALVRQARRGMAALEDRMLAPMTPDERVQFVERLRGCATALEPDAQPAAG